MLQMVRWLVLGAGAEGHRLEVVGTKGHKTCSEEVVQAPKGYHIFPRSAINYEHFGAYRKF